MNIHEYQGKEILKSFGVAVQEGIVADTVEQAVEAAKKMNVRASSAGAKALRIKTDLVRVSK